MATPLGWLGFSSFLLLSIFLDREARRGGQVKAEDFTYFYCARFGKSASGLISGQFDLTSTA